MVDDAPPESPPPDRLAPLSGEELKRAAWVIAPIAVVFAFFGTGELAFVDPTMLMWIGILTAFGLTTLTWTTSTPTVFQRILGLLLTGTVLFWGAWELIRALPEAESASRANDIRCLAIQVDMLAAHPRKEHGAELFTALRCRPQGYDGRIFAPPTDRERRARRPLPFGGYPPPA